MTELTDEERDVIQHTLTGGTRFVYRNFFCASEGHTDMSTIEALVERGLMEHHVGWIFRATVAGAESVGQKLP